MVSYVPVCTLLCNYMMIIHCKEMYHSDCTDRMMTALLECFHYNHKTLLQLNRLLLAILVSIYALQLLCVRVMYSYGMYIII